MRREHDDSRTVSGRGRAIGKAPCYVVAEAGVCHNGDVGLAKEMISVAKRVWG